MAGHTYPTDQAPPDWAQLAAQPAAEREAQLRRFYAHLAMLPKAEQLVRLRSMVATTYALPDAAFRAITIAA